MVTQDTFRGLAFPVACVRFAGPTNYSGSRYYATIRRDSERTYRATTSFDYALGPGENALAAARKAHAAACKDTGNDPAEYVAIPGDLSADAYVFTFVPLYLFNGAAS